jgi:hypothetical protein
MEFDWYCTGLLFCIRYPVLVLLSVSFSVLLFVQLFDLFCFCSVHFVHLFSVKLFFYSVLLSVLILELYSRYFDPVLRKEVTCYHHQPSSKSINIILVPLVYLLGTLLLCQDPSTSAP